MDVAKGYGGNGDPLISRASYDAERVFLHHILEGKQAVTPPMERVPGELMETLTSGQRAATRMIPKRKTASLCRPGLCRGGQDHQFPAVMSAVNLLPEE